MDVTPSLYEQLEAHARRLLRERRMRDDPETLSLVHEAWAKIARGKQPELNSRGETLAYCSKVLRSVLLNLARNRLAARRGGGKKAAQIDDNAQQQDSRAEERADAQVIDVNEQLDRLEEHDPRLARLVEMRFFGAFEWAEIAEAMDCTPQKVRSEWRFARMWLRRALADSPDDGGDGIDDA